MTFSNWLDLLLDFLHYICRLLPNDNTHTTSSLEKKTENKFLKFKNYNSLSHIIFQM